jgi:hypothetical protein
MARQKNGSGELTRAALESYIWAATGWRGDPAVIDGILGKTDIYAANRVRQAGIVAQERAEAVAASAEAGRMTPEPPEGAPISQKVLDALVDAMEAARSASTYAARAVLAVQVAEQAISEAQAAALSMEPVEAPVGPSPEQVQAAEEMTAEFEAEHGSVSAEAVAEAVDTLTRKLPVSLGAGVGGPANLSEQEIAEYYDTHDTVTCEEITQETLDDDAEADAIVDAILNGTEESAPTAGWVEVDADTGQAAGPASLAEPDRDGQKRCTKCERVKAFSEFYRDKQAADGYKGSCKKCDAKRAADKAAAARRGDAERTAEAILAEESE